MGEPPIRILLLGADASMWIGLSSTLASRSSQIFVPKEVDLESIRSAASDVEVVVAVLNGEGPERLHPLHLVAQAGLEKKTIVLAQPDDHQVASDAVLLGVAGLLQHGCTPERLAMAIEQVTAQGIVYDASGAAELHSRMGMAGRAGPSNLGAAKALASALELKDTYTGGHAERVTAMALRLARVAMIEEALPSEALEAAFLLHDVGKIGIPESILNKPGGLSDTERRVLETHPILGERVVTPLGFPDVVRHVIRHHHERWDGSGYPDRLAGTEIPAAARLFSIADVLDAMTSLRPYRKPVSFQAAVKEIRDHAGTQFDPTLCELVDATFVNVSPDVVVPFS
jgi:ribonuclease P protein subunit RPR2